MANGINFKLTTEYGNPPRVLNKWFIPGYVAATMCSSVTKQEHHEVYIPVFRPLNINTYEVDISIDGRRYANFGNDMQDAAIFCLSEFSAKERAIFFEWYKNNKLEWLGSRFADMECVVAPIFDLYGILSSDRIAIRSGSAENDLAYSRPTGEPISDRITLINMIMGEIIKKVNDATKTK